MSKTKTTLKISHNDWNKLGIEPKDGEFNGDDFNKAIYQHCLKNLTDDFAAGTETVEEGWTNTRIIITNFKKVKSLTVTDISRKNNVFTLKVELELKEKKQDKKPTRTISK